MGFRFFSPIFALALTAAVAFGIAGCASQPPLPESRVLGPFHYGADPGNALTEYAVSRPATAGLLPAVVLIHGGGWTRGTPADMERYIPHVLRSGWVAINTGYRLAPEARWPAQRDDLHRLMADISDRANQIGVDPKRIAILGYSAGAHLGLVAGTQPNPRVPRPVALALGAGPYDLRAYPESELVLKLLGGPPSVVGNGVFNDASPFLHVNAFTPPTYLWHGNWDLTVDIDQSRNLVRALEKAKVPVQLDERFGRGHITNYLVDADAWVPIDAFLRRWLEPVEE